MTDNNTALKPCPFCGSFASVYPSSEHSTAWIGGCATTDKEGCIGTDLIWEDSEAEAISAWNTRTPAPPIDREALVDVLEQHIVDTFDVDWTARWAAEAIADYLPEILEASAHVTPQQGFTIIHPSGLGGGGRDTVVALLEALEDIAHGRGMFGVDPSEDLKWAMERAGAALKATEENMYGG